MKRMQIFVVMAMALLFSANVFAGDVGDVSGSGNNIGIGLDNTSTNTNNNTATGGDAESLAIGTGGDADATIGDIAVNGGGQHVNTPRQFLAAPGFVTGIIPGTAPESGEWAEYCPSSEPVSVEKIRRAKGGTGFFHDLFKGRKSLDITEISEPIDREVKEVQCLPWPKDEKWSTASMTLAGDTRAPQARVEASIEDACVNLGFQYYAIRGGRQHETATYGNSLGLSAAASEVGSKTGTAAAVGGQLGNNRVRNERYWEAEAVCLSDEYAAFLVTSPPVKAEKKPLADEKPVTSTPLADTRSEERTINVNVTCKSEPALATTTPAVPPPAKIAEPPCSKCSNETITKFNELLKKHSDEIDGCDRWSFYNMTKRLERAHDYIELYACTRDVKYLRLAENDYQIAESNHQLGWDISKHQVEADKLMADGYMTWAGVTYVLHGQNALNDFVVRKRIEDGRKVPTEFNP